MAMQFPFRDYGKQTFAVSNGSSRTWTAPYDCMVVFGDIQFDDENNGRIRVLDLAKLQGGATDNFVLFDGPNLTSNARSGLSYCIRSGQRILIEAVDDFRVTLHFFRLP